MESKANTPSPEVRERLERLLAIVTNPESVGYRNFDWGGTSDGRALQELFETIPALLAQSAEQAAWIEALMAEIARLRSPGVWQELMAADARRVLGDPMQSVSGSAIEEWPL